MFLRGLTFLLPFIASANIPPPSFEGHYELIVNNRILTRVNGKTISVLDLVKKMDVYLNRYYPQYAKSKSGRYQFYTANWRDILNQMIDNELITADAESRKVFISDGEIRQEIQSRFGPNIRLSLDQLDLTYDEARKIVHQDMIVERMNWLRVTSKALQRVNSQDVKEAYRQFCEANPPQDEWRYQLLSIRSDQKEVRAQLGEKARKLIQTEGYNLNQVAEKLKSENGFDARISIQVSQDYEVADKTLSQAHREVLMSLNVGSFSPPLEQLSRDQSTVCRIFHLKGHSKKELPKLEEVAHEIKDRLLQQVVSEETALYVSKLRTRFGYDPQSLDIPSDFEPFILR